MALADYQTALVTGASSGIGEATVRRLRAEGLVVHAVARRADKLEALAAETGCVAHGLDLLDRDALYAALAELEIDILVNNAGTVHGFDGLHRASAADITRTIQTNVEAVLHVLRALTPGMIERGRGHVVTIGSVAGLYPINSTIYGSSKGAIHLLCQNLRIELQGSGVRSTEICPGRVRTELFDAAISDAAILAKTKATGIRDLDAADVADAILYVLNTPWHVNISTLEIVPTEQSYGGTRFVRAEAQSAR